jgi:hypothetical protein
MRGLSRPSSSVRDETARFHPLGMMPGIRQVAIVVAMIVWILVAVAYVTLFFWLGLATLRNGHGLLFFFGIFLPVLWIFGALSAPAAERW